MARDHRAVVEGALALKKAGNALMRVVGGREIHPVNVRVGGFYRAPDAAPSWRRCVERARARRASSRCEAVALDRGAAVPRLRGGLRASSRCATRTEYAIERGRLVSSTRPRPRAARVRRALRRGARPALDRAALAPARRDALPRRPAGPLRAQPRPALAGRARGGRRGGARAGVPQPVPQHRRARGRDPLRVRRGAAAASTPTSRRTRRRRGRRRAPASGYGWTEAPRGLLWHRYEIDADGHDPRRADRAADLAEPGPHRAEPARLRRAAPRRWTTTSCSLRCEQAVRSYDPCISCATHFLRTGDRPRRDRHRRRQRLARRRRRRPRRRPARARAGARRRRGARGRGRRDGAGGRVVGRRARRRRRRRASGAAPGHRAALRRPLAAAAGAQPALLDARLRRRRTPSSWRDRWTACRAGSTSTRSRARASSPATA